METTKVKKTKLKDNSIFRTIIIIVSLLFIFGFKYVPLSASLSQDAVGVIGIFIGSLILWLTISIDWPSVLCLFALGFLQNFSFANVFSSSFGNSTFIFLLFTFICTYALSKTLLLKRIAIWFVSSKLARKNGWFFAISFLFAVLILGCFISPSVLFVIILPILNEILSIAKIEKGEKAGKMLMLGLAFTVSISSGMTPIAHVFPIISMNAAHISVSYWQYMAFAVPVGLLCFVLMLLMFKLILRPNMNKLNGFNTQELKVNMPKIEKREIWSLAIFIFVIILWILPSLFQNILPEVYSFINKYGTAMPPILGTLLLCIIRVEKEPLINLPDAFKNGVPWASMLMCAGTLALGSAMTSEAIGLKTFLQTNLSSALNGFPELLLIIIFVVWPAIQTNLSSNMVTATLVATVCASVLRMVPQSSINFAAIICMIGMLSAYAFATPPSMPHIAIAAGSEYADTNSVLIYGTILMVISIVISVCVGYPIAMLVM